MAMPFMGSTLTSEDYVTHFHSENSTITAEGTIDFVGDTFSETWSGTHDSIFYGWDYHVSDPVTYYLPLTYSYSGSFDGSESEHHSHAIVHAEPKRNRDVFGHEADHADYRGDGAETGSGMPTHALTAGGSDPFGSVSFTYRNSEIRIRGRATTTIDGIETTRTDSHDPVRHDYGER